jgi:hypothetical protein
MTKVKKGVRIGDEIFSPNLGFLRIEADRGAGKEREIMFTILKEEYWIKSSKVQ